MKSKRPVLLVALLLFLAVAIGGGYWLGVNPQVLPFHDGAGDGDLVLYGNIELREAMLAFNGSELVDEVLVEEGDRVERGQPLATLDTRRLKDAMAEAVARRDAQAQALRRLEAGSRPQEIEQARAALRGAEARRANAVREVERLQETAASGATTQQQLDAALAARDIAQADLEVRRQALALALAGPREEDIAEARARLRELDAAIASLQTRLDDSTLEAPSAGVIQSRVLEPGEFASPSRPVLVLALTERKWARVYVPETELGRVAPGMAASVSTDTFPDEAFGGQVGFVSPTAEFTPKTVQTSELRTQLVYEVRIGVDDAGDRLRLGQPVTVVIHPSRSAGGEGSAARTADAEGGGR